MGRAIVRSPQAFLMDEPLRNLDAKLRVSTRAQLAALHDRLGVTTIYVTHDQIEAMTLGTRVAVLKDQPNQSACAGACAAAWPVDQPSGTPKAGGGGVQASLLGTITRSDGTTQVTYNHHPLYYYSGDSGPGEQNGQGLNAFGARWYVVAPSGESVTDAGS
jgi:predicted lipoprotein with Yx(FWY)xxD motif